MAGRVLRGATRAAAFMLIVGGLGSLATAGDVVEIEEQWSLVVGGPETEVSSPQISMVMSASGHTESDFFLVALNHWSSPEFAPGGIQAQHWCGDERVTVANSSDKQPLHHDGETISWAQRLTLSGGQLLFQVLDGQGESWGNFADGSTLRIAVPTELTRLNDYKPAVSIHESGIGYAGNRVSSLVLQRIRWRFDGEEEYNEMVAPIDIDSDLDP